VSGFFISDVKELPARKVSFVVSPGGAIRTGPFESRKIKASGACSNPRVQLELPKLGVLKDRLLREAAVAPRQHGRAPTKRDPVLETVTLVLERADRPMGAREIHRAAEQLLGRSLRWASVRGVLSAYAIGSDRRFRRVGRGIYEVRSPA